MNTKFDFPKNIIVFSVEGAKKTFDMDAARDVLWLHSPWLVKAYSLTTVSNDGSISYQVDWKSLFTSPTGKLILLQHGKNIS